MSLVRVTPFAEARERHRTSTCSSARPPHSSSFIRGSAASSSLLLCVYLSRASPRPHLVTGVPRTTGHPFQGENVHCNHSRSESARKESPSTHPS